MSPPMVVAYALAGDATVNLAEEPVAEQVDGSPVYLQDLWPSPAEIDAVLAQAIDPADFRRDFREASTNRLWREIDAPDGPLFPWDPQSTILRPPPFAEPGVGPRLGNYAAHPLLVLGDDITTDHISPASAIPRDSFIADFLVERGENRDDLNVFASRRGNWEVMVRGAFYAKAVHNALAPEAGTAMTTHGPSGEVMSVFDAAKRYHADDDAVVVIAGDRYGMGSSRDWAAKVQHLLGVRAVLAAGFERIHRSNLIGMGILPLVVPEKVRDHLAALRPGDRVAVHAEPDALFPRCRIPVEILTADPDESWSFNATAAIDTGMDVELLRAGGVIPTILSSAGGDVGSDAPSDAARLSDALIAP